MKQWAIGFHMYCDDNRDIVPDEGNAGAGINNTGSSSSTDNYHFAWYNVIPPTISMPTLVQLYSQTNPPLPGSSTIFSCPSCPDPNYSSPINYNNPPTFSQAFFMYGENNRLCVNFSTVSSGKAPQTRLSTIVKPSATIFMAENDPNSALSIISGTFPPASSGVTGYYAVARHAHNTLANFSLTDGSCRGARTNDFKRSQKVADNCYGTDGPAAPAEEWDDKVTPKTPNFLYWYPSPYTLN